MASFTVSCGEQCPPCRMKHSVVCGPDPCLHEFKQLFDPQSYIFVSWSIFLFWNSGDVLASDQSPDEKHFMKRPGVLRGSEQLERDESQPVGTDRVTRMSFRKKSAPPHPHKRDKQHLLAQQSGGKQHGADSRREDVETKKDSLVNPGGCWDREDR